ncbi:hypothetical protein NMG60_11027459 [Bertholletia excelsa]
MKSICWGESSQSVLLRKLEVALKDHNLDEAWKTYKDFRNWYGFPDHSVMSRLIIELSYSSDSHWLQRACDLVLNVQRVDSDLLYPNLLSLSLARAHLPVPACRLFRLMLEKQSLPTVNILGLFFLHMVKTQIGISTSSKLIKPGTTIFNLVLDACVRFGSSFKSHQMINDQRDELKKFEDHIDQVLDLVPLVHHYRQFYDSLLSLHFKYDDVDFASGLILDMYRCKESLHIQKKRKDPPKPCFVPIESPNLRAGLKIQISPELLPDSVLKVENEEDLITNCKAFIQYKRYGRTSDLSRILIDIQKNGSLKGENLNTDVIEACISLGWLEIAHDIIDDMKLAGSPLDTSSYMSLLRVYNERNMFREAEALLRQIRKAGLSVKISDDTIKGATSSGKSDLAESFIRELGQEKCVPSLAKMVHDALTTYRKMQGTNIKPTLQTYINMVFGYSSLEMSMENGILMGDRDLFEFIMSIFLRGGYFERVMEVISYMKNNGYLHKDLYRSLKAGSAKTEAQSKRIEHARAFRKGIDIN